MDAWKVLLVDDEEEFVSTLAERLRLRGIEAATALDGEEALRLLDSDPPHVVVLDVMMPGIGGMEVLRRIRVQHPEMPVILLTGHGCNIDEMEGRHRGAFDCLMKPLNIDELIHSIRQALGTQPR